MPHDAKGEELKAGDRVIFHATVKEVWPTETACNANFSIDDKAASGEYAPNFTCNTRLCEKVEPTPNHGPLI